MQEKRDVEPKGFLGFYDIPEIIDLKSATLIVSCSRCTKMGAQGGPGEQARGSNEEEASSEEESERLKLASQVMDSTKNQFKILDDSDKLCSLITKKRIEECFKSEEVTKVQ